MFKYKFNSVIYYRLKYSYYYYYYFNMEKCIKFYKNDIRFWSNFQPQTITYFTIYCQRNKIRTIFF